MQLYIYNQYEHNRKRGTGRRGKELETISAIQFRIWDDALLDLLDKLNKWNIVAEFH